MKQHLIFLVVTLQLFVCVTSSNEDWDKVFGVQGEQLEPKKTKEVLKKLNSYYSTQSGKSAVDKKLQLRFLIDAGKVSVSKCYQEREEEDNLLWESFAEYQLNIEPYLKHYKQLQIDLCKSPPTTTTSPSPKEEETAPVETGLEFEEILITKFKEILTLKKKAIKTKKKEKKTSKAKCFFLCPMKGNKMMF